MLEYCVRDVSLVDMGAFQRVPCLFTHFQGTCDARLDRIYASSLFMGQVHYCCVIPVHFSDHCLVTVSFGKRRQRKFHPQ